MVFSWPADALFEGRKRRLFSRHQGHFAHCVTHRDMPERSMFEFTILSDDDADLPISLDRQSVSPKRRDQPPCVRPLIFKARAVFRG